MELNAEFYWDSLAPNGIPYPMIGEGKIELTETGLIATGFRKGSGAKAVLVFLAYCVGAILSGVVFMLLLPDVLRVVGMAAGLFGALGIYWRFHRNKAPQDPRGEPMRLNILWGAILEVGESRGFGSVYVKIGARSTLYFVPQLNGRSLLEFLHELRVRNSVKPAAKAAA